MAVRMVRQVRTKSCYEVGSIPFDEIPEETDPLLINGLQDFLQAAVHVWRLGQPDRPLNP